MWLWLLWQASAVSNRIRRNSIYVHIRIEPACTHVLLRLWLSGLQTSRTFPPLAEPRYPHKPFEGTSHTPRTFAWSLWENVLHVQWFPLSRMWTYGAAPAQKQCQGKVSGRWDENGSLQCGCTKQKKINRQKKIDLCQIFCLCLFVYAHTHRNAYLLEVFLCVCQSRTECSLEKLCVFAVLVLCCQMFSLTHRLQWQYELEPHNEQQLKCQSHCTCISLVATAIIQLWQKRIISITKCPCVHKEQVKVPNTIWSMGLFIAC